MKILIVCDHASLRYGGEAQLPLHYFRALRQLRGLRDPELAGDHAIEVRLLAHARSRLEIEQLFADDLGAIDFVDENAFDRIMWAIGRHLPHAVYYASVGLLARLSVQRRQRRVIRRLVASEGIDLVHQPTPVSPCEPSMLHGLGVPVVIGPMNGGMDYPPAFATGRGFLESEVRRMARAMAPSLNRVFRGKAEAALLIVANDRTFAALPVAPEVPVEVLGENGVDLDRWSPAIRPAPEYSGRDAVPTFVFVGRLVRLKAVDLLLEAFKRASARTPMRLVIVGDGVERAALEAQAAALGGSHAPDGSAGSVRFTGHLSPIACAALMKEADALVFPSLNDCGGAVILEAMASGLPVVATAWGGALEYVAPSCGILVAPRNREVVIDGFSEAMLRLAGAPELRRAMGKLAHARARSHYSWPAKAQRLLGLYSNVLARDGGQRIRGLPDVRRGRDCRPGDPDPPLYFSKMSRLLVLVFLLMLPLQFAWSAASAYCQHESAPQGAHFGHHVHWRWAAISIQPKTRVGLPANGAIGARSAGDEEVEVHGRADRVRATGGRVRHASGRCLPLAGHQRYDVLCLEEEVRRARRDRTAVAAPADRGERTAEARRGQLDSGPRRSCRR